MLLNQEGFSNSPLSAGQLKAQGSEVSVSSNGSHLFGCHGSTGEPLGGGPGFSKHLTQQGKKIAPQAQYQECPPHTVTHSPHTSQQPVFTLIPSRVHTAVFALRGGCPVKMLKQREGEKMERITRATIGAQLSVCFCLNVTGSRFFIFLLRETPELHLCYKCLQTGSYPPAGLFCIGSSLIITLNMLLK